MTLREARFHKRLNQWDVSLRTGISQTKISLIERGYIEPGEEEKKKIAKALNCLVTDIFSKAELHHAGPR